jgi:hypothetical protein
MEIKMNPMINRESNAITAKQIEIAEDITALLESQIWEWAIKTLFRENLQNAKTSLLNNTGLPTETRVGYIMYRQKVMDSFKSMYRKHDVQIPEWLED